MKNPLEITQDVLNGMIGIGGIPTNQEFYDEFNDRLKAALSLHNVVGQSEQLINFTKEVIEMYEKYDIGDEDIYRKAKAIIN
ncbi:MAG: hypothetical protein HRU18_03810 [Pseudoalteromonas sp.]|uniref:hypothetical protein n=1 Tax=Pseudoalteromonas sp. TaxID=53249 RepID=UPI001D388BE1|nr:hypothetical protein [Pseudoalteromonas sp.]NRA77313.1 hypothetical protein [Pseudoalteromonas sp.]